MRPQTRRTILSAVTMLGAAGLLAGLAMWGVFSVRRQGRAPQVPVQVAPEPRLQVQPDSDLEEYLRGQRKRLGSIGWVDRDAGVVHIPVERAAERLLERGFPVRAPADSREPG